jgi:hypothetical protein
MSGLVAVCLSGELRSFYQPSVQEGLIKRLDKPGYEYFISTDHGSAAAGPRPESIISTGRGASAPWNDSISNDSMGSSAGAVVGSTLSVRSVYVDSGETLRPDRNGNEHGQLSCPRGTMTHPYLFPMTVRFVACARLIFREERQRRFSYTHVIRTRTDLLFVGPFPHPEEALARANADVLLFDDQVRTECH